MATVQNNKIEFVIGDKAKISAADAYRLWFDTTHKQIILKGLEFIPKKLSELTNDSGFISSITKAMVEGVLTGTISSHTHAFSSLTSKPTTLSGYGITDGVTTSSLSSSLSKYLPLNGGTITGSLTVNTDIIVKRYISTSTTGATGFVGCFNQSKYALKGAGTHLFGGGSKGQGNNAIALGANSWAGVRNQDPDKDTYPYLAWQWMNTQPIEVNTTTSSLGGGTFYGYPLLGGEVVEYSTPDGGLFTYENTGQRLQFLLLVKNYDKFVFAGSASSSEPRNVVCYMFGGMYVFRNVINKVTERVIGDTTYYEVVVNQGSATALDYTKYNPSNQIQLLCATKCNNSNFSGASSYIAGDSALTLNNDCIAFGNQSIALGMQSIATTFCSNAIGYNSVAAESYSFSFGSSSYALGNNSFAFGSSSVAKGYRSTAFGPESVTLGSYSIAFGRRSVAKGDFSMAFGQESIASPPRAMTFGAYSKCTQTDSMNFALYGLSHHPSQSVFGKYNKPEDAALIVGGGTGTVDAARKNIFKVDWSGNVTGKYFSGYSNSVGGEGFKIYPESSNEINFGGTGSSPIIVFGASSKDSRAVPTTYKFGANGDASLIGSSFSGNSATATKLSTPRTLTIGNTGKTFDGSEDISWTLEEIGAKDENVKYTTSVDNVDYRLTAIGQRIAGNVEGVNGVVTADGITMNPSTGNLKATSFTGSLKGNADTATKLGTTTIGGSGTPIYLNNGVPTACNLTADDISSTMSGEEGNSLGDSINLLLMYTEDNANRIDSILTALDNKASTAVVTASTNGLMSSEMYNTEKVSSINVRQGAAASEETVRNHDIYVTYNKDKALNSDAHKVGGDEQIKIPNATTDYDGSMSYADKRKLDSFNVDTSTNYYMGNVVRINGNYMLPQSATITDLRDYAPIYGIIADHLELQNGISSDKIPEMIRLSIHNITYMFSLNTIDYTNNQIVYVCPYVQVQFTIDSSTGQFEINSFNPI